MFSLGCPAFQVILELVGETVNIHPMVPVGKQISPNFDAFVRKYICYEGILDALKAQK